VTRQARWPTGSGSSSSSPRTSAYSSAFLLERERRTDEAAEAAEAWQAIVDWNEARGFELQAEWPKQELARLRSALPDS
jgi:hypothetical protein